MLDFTVNSLNTHFAQASVQLPACNLHTLFIRTGECNITKSSA